MSYLFRGMHLAERVNSSVHLVDSTQFGTGVINNRQIDRREWLDAMGWVLHLLYLVSYTSGPRVPPSLCLTPITWPPGD